MKLRELPITQADYDALEYKDPNTLYCIVENIADKEKFISDLNLALKNNFDFVPLEATLRVAEELFKKGWANVL